MCGIFGLINYGNIDRQRVYQSFETGKNRGPEYSATKEINDNVFFGFHRLAINGINNESNQPFDIKNCVLICNGEIYNFKELANDHNIKLITQSDCEIIIHLYKLHGIEYTLNLLDGVFAFMLYDEETDLLHIARDPYGVRPLYYSFDTNYNSYCFASELKCIKNLVEYNFKKHIKSFEPGSFLTIYNTKTIITSEQKKYTKFPFTNTIYLESDYNNLYTNIVNKLSKAVKKRVIGTTDRPIACLLSGGLDSSLIAALVNQELINSNNSQKLKTFSIGLPGSEDLKYAKIVAEHINSEHYEIVLSEDKFFHAIPEVIYNIESYDTTTVRASVGNYLIAKNISNYSDCKVIFNGDGADELMGGYLYFKHSPNEFEFDKECKRLLTDIHNFDVLRSDKSISSNGLEPRTPFLDREWSEFYLSIDKKLRYNTTVNNCEKYLIRKAFSIIKPDLLPNNILWRTKEAFSDGVSSLDKSWYQIINEKINGLYELEYDIINMGIQYKNNKSIRNTPVTTEQCYYRYLFNKYYFGCDNIIPYYWMPKFINASDASARTLSFYKQNNSNMEQEE